MVRRSGKALAAAVLARMPPPVLRRVRAIPVLGPATSRLSHRLSPPGERVWVTVRGGAGAGLELAIDPRFEGLLWSGAWEVEMQEALIGALREGANVYDVGSHVGFMALSAARAVGPGGRVFAFEPDPENRARLIHHVERNGFANVEVVPRAVWSHAGTVGFTRASTDAAGLQGRASEAGGDVEAVTLDEFALDHPAPDVVKIDVEGAELEVLGGARRVLAEHRPTVLCEIHLEAGGHAERLPEVTRLLEDAGYAVEQLTPQLDPTHVVARPR